MRYIRYITRFFQKTTNDKNQVIIKELLFLYCTSSSFVIVNRILQFFTV